MKTWSDVQEFCNKHSLPYKVERFNMSLAGVLVDRDTGGAVANTVKESRIFLTGYAKALKTRYAEQCDLYPTLRNDVREQGYVATNLPYAVSRMLFE